MIQEDGMRHVCTADDPWTPEKSARAQHPDAEWIEAYDDFGAPSWDKYRCPHCGLEFKVECPQ